MQSVARYFTTIAAAPTPPRPSQPAMPASLPRASRRSQSRDPPARCRRTLPRRSASVTRTPSGDHGGRAQRVSFTSGAPNGPSYGSTTSTSSASRRVRRSASAAVERHDPRRGRDTKVAGYRRGYDGREPGPVEAIRGDHQRWPPVPGLRSERLAEVDPPDIAALYHSQPPTTINACPTKPAERA